MEIGSISNSGNLGTTLTQAVEKGQNVDAFSELFAMLFGNMFLQSSNGLSLMMNQNSFTDLKQTAGDSLGLEDMMSISNSLRINSGAFTDFKSIQSFISSNSFLSSILGNNTDFQKLFNLQDSIPDELQEFINNINGFDSKAPESLGGVLKSDASNIITEQLDNNVNTSMIERNSQLLNVGNNESENAIELETFSELLDIPVIENTTVQESKKSSEMQNIQAPAGKSQNSAEDTVNTIIDTRTSGNEDAINNFLSHDESKVIIHEEKIKSTFVPTGSLEYSTGFNNIRNDSINEADLKQGVIESNIIENPQDLIDITVEKFKTLRLPGSTKVTVKLKPEELGEVSLKLVLEKGQINGSITADRKEVVQMLQNNLEQLKADLKSSNVNLNNLSVNIQAGEDFDRNNSRQGFTSKHHKNSHKIIQAFDEEVQSQDMLEGLNIIA